MGAMGIKLKCKVHGVPLVCFCPACRGAATSERKARSSRRNGRLGGRPRLPDNQIGQAACYQRERQARLKQQAKKKKGVRR